jgi:hypothetical protein
VASSARRSKRNPLQAHPRVLAQSQRGQELPDERAELEPVSAEAGADHHRPHPVEHEVLVGRVMLQHILHEDLQAVALIGRELIPMVAAV